MADNVVQITVTSKNSTKAGFQGAKADAESAAGGIAAIFEKMHGKIGKSMAGLAGGLGAAALWARSVPSRSRSLRRSPRRRRLLPPPRPSTPKR